MKIVTSWVMEDEPCHGLREEPRIVALEDGSRQWRWVQTVFVVRGDAIAAHATDLGPADDFEDVMPLMMPSFGDDTVAELREHADKNRQDTYWANRSKEMLAESTLVEDHVRQVLNNREIIRNRSVSGPAITVQRNNYSHTRAMRKLRERTGQKVW